LFDRFTEQARRVLVLAERESAHAGHDAIDTGDLVVALASEDTGVACEALTAGAGATVHALTAINREHASSTSPSALASALGMADDARASLQSAAAQAVVADARAEVSTGHLLVAILDQSDNRARHLLEQAGIDPDAVRDDVLLLMKEGHRDGSTVEPLSPSLVVPALLAAWDAPAEVADAVATAGAPDDRRLQWLLADWLVRACVPEWLVAADLDAVAGRLRTLEPITSSGPAEAAADAIDEAAAALADVVPGFVPEALRVTVAGALNRARADSGERGAEAALAVDLSESVMTAATDGVRRAMGLLVLRTAGDDNDAGLWAHALTAARRAAEGEGRGGAGRRPGRSGRARRLRERIDGEAVRAALCACCGQLVDDAGWIVAGASADVTLTAAPLVDGLRAALSAALTQLPGDVLL
jgi:hypothetical protein